jgi:hypothetical protein
MIFIILSLFLAACGGEQQLNEEQQLATVVASTMMAMEADPQTADAPTAPPSEIPIPEGDMQPLTPAECDDLAISMGRTLEGEVSSETVPVTMSWSGETGGACQMTVAGDGNKFKGIFDAFDSIQHMMLTQGWWGGDTLTPCLGHGGAGPNAKQSCYVNETKICEAMVTFSPIDMQLCEGIEGPIGVCMAELTPEQQIYKIALTCAQGTMTVPLPKTEPERIEFAAGATSAQVTSTIHPYGLHPYVLTAMEGQQMTVTLHKNENAVAALSIWGLDGTVLISDHAGATFWSGLLPATQDYYIDVISQDPGIFDYTLEISIPPAQSAPNTQVFPKVEPFPFGYMQSIVGFTVPPMLPPEFSTEAGLPEIVPFPITTEMGKYLFSLEYGSDCMGAGACHYGAIGGMQTTSPTPTHFNTYYPFESERAEQVTLAYDITGYFVDYTCGANCNDATVWWIYNGYQYMIGLKAGPRDQVIALANAAITNSIP